MPFQPAPGDRLELDGKVYTIAEHPAAPGMPYGQEGRQATVFALEAPDGARAALKVFKPRFRKPALVTLAERLERFSELPGLTVCRRTVLSGGRHAAVLRTNPDLTYAVVMPWVAGPTWTDVLLDRRALAPAAALALARGLARALTAAEERGVAHCDLSAPNLLLPALAGGAPNGQEAIPAFVDVEQMYAPGLERPEALPAGSPGYAHRAASEGLWQPSADRFAGAVLLAEMLAWCEEPLRSAAWGESFFDPAEMQRAGGRWQQLLGCISDRWGQDVALLLRRAWESETLDDCPTFGEWLVTLPESVPPSHAASGAEPDGEAPRRAAVRALTAAAERLHAAGNLAGALENYRSAVALDPADAALAARIAVLAATPAPALSGPAAALVDELLAAYRIADWGVIQALLGRLATVWASMPAGAAAPPVPTTASRSMPAAAPAQPAASSRAMPSPAPLPSTPAGMRVVLLAETRRRRSGGPETAAVTSVAFTPDSRHVLAATLEGELWQWEMGGSGAPVPLYLLLSASSQLRGVAALDQEQALTAGADGMLRHCRLTLPSSVTIVAAFGRPVADLALSPDGALVALAVGHGVTLLRTDSYAVVRSLRGRMADSLSVCFSGDGQRVAASSTDGSVIVWDVASGRLTCQIAGAAAMVRPVALNADGRLVATGEPGWAAVYNATNGRVLARIDGLHRLVRALAFTEDARLAVTGDDGSVWLCGATKGDVAKTPRHSAGAARSLAISPDGRLLAAGDDAGRVTVWALS